MSSYSMPLYRAKALNTYRTSSIETASPGELILMLYNEVIRCANEAMAHLEKGDIEKSSSRMLKAQDIIDELRASLNMVDGGEIAQRLDAVYEYAYSSLIRANVKKDQNELRNAIDVFSELREGWEEVLKKNG